MVSTSGKASVSDLMLRANNQVWVNATACFWNSCSDMHTIYYITIKFWWLDQNKVTQFLQSLQDCTLYLAAIVTKL